MKIKDFTIKKQDAYNFSKLSGDNNPIHLDSLKGYNSMYGKNITHGVLPVLNLLNKINFKYLTKSIDKFIIKIEFKKPIYYNKKISINLSNRELSKYFLYQNSILSTIVSINLGQNIELKKSNYNKTTNLKVKKLKSHKFRNVPEDILFLLSSISRYVGTINPGENSLLGSININYNKNLSNYNPYNLKIRSKLLNKRLPMIINNFSYKKLKTNFISYKLPVFLNQNLKPKSQILNEIIKYQSNILILGASSGIGRELLNLYINNKNIKIIGTYNKNKILLKNKNVILKKINIENKKIIKQIEKLIIKYKICRIYYMSTPKIYFDVKKSKELNKLYSLFYYKIPLQIINKFVNKNLAIHFFYPSTEYVIKNSTSLYSRYKIKAEKEFSKKKYPNNQISIFRFPGIFSKQNLSIIPQKLTSFISLINVNKEARNKIFFK